MLWSKQQTFFFSFKNKAFKYSDVSMYSLCFSSKIFFVYEHNPFKHFSWNIKCIYTDAWSDVQLNLVHFNNLMTSVKRSKSFVLLIYLISSLLLPVSEASVVSSGDFNKDFLVTWSPTHVNTSSDGRSRTLKLDQESGT